jgi:hypothetical protein
MKKHALFIFSMFIALGSWGQAPSWAWAKSAGGISSEWADGVSIDASGNVIVIGIFASPTMTVGSTTLSNSGMATNDIYVVKYDPSGNVLWAKSMGGTWQEYVYGISTDASGNVVVTGSFESSTMTIGSTTLTNSGVFLYDADIFVVKYDPSGNVLWAKSEGGAAGHGVSTDASRNVVVTGRFFSPTMTIGSTTLTNAGSADIFVVKYDPSGNVLWAKSEGGTGQEYVYGISTDASGNIVVTGSFESPTMTVGSTTLTKSGSGADIFVVKYDPSGNVLWAKSAGGAGGEWGRGISTDAIGNIFITGFFTSPSITLGSTTLTKSGSGDDIFVVKYDLSGNVLWAKSAGGTGDDGGLGISTDASGNAFATGFFSSPTMTIGSTTLTNSGGLGDDNDIFVVKYDPSGNVLWAKSEGGNANDETSGISTDASGNVVVTGFFTSPTITIGSTILTNAGNSDIFVAKLSSATGIEILSKEAEMLVSPNPFNNSTLIQLPESVQNAEIIVSDLLGKKVIAKKFSGKEYLLEKGNMSPGIYFVQINDGQHQYPITKIVVQ